MERDPEQIGFGKPPTATRFKKGQSGNPRGRPRKPHNRDIPYDSLLGQMVTIREDGKQRRVTAAEAFLLQITKLGLAGNNGAARHSLAAIENARARCVPDSPLQVRIVWKSISPGSVGCGIEPLSIATKLNRYSEDKARFQLNPWIVQAALERIGSRQLSEEEQVTVVEATLRPETIDWPRWWSVRPWTSA